MGHVTLTTPIRGSVMLRLALDIFHLRTYYIMWRLSLQPFRRYDCGHRNWK